MFPTGLPSPNPPPPAQEPRPAASDVHNDCSLTSSKKRKINSSEKEDIDSISSSPKAICNSSSTTSSSQQQQHIQKKLRFEDPLDVKMAEESCNSAESCSKARNVFLPGGVGHHANGLTKSAGSATFSNSKPGAAKKLVIKNFKGR
ncbi:cullin-4B-like [Sinocyclocheilus anshuiensis]|nr:PREDICTED: cullin-4B-like [Sinocyclocheilus anshuiensis]